MKRLSVRTAFAAALSVSLLSAAVGAQPNNDLSAIARSHYETGSRYYAIQRFPEAAREFQEAYNITHRTELLFNIGRAHEDAALGERDEARRREHNQSALDAYQLFLDAGAPGVDRVALVGRMNELRDRLAAARRAPDVRLDPNPSSVMTHPLPPPASRSYALPITLMAVGGALVGAGVYTGLTARSIHEDLVGQCGAELRCAPSLQADADRGHLFAIATDVLVGVGAASVVVGVIAALIPSRRAAGDAGAPAVAFGCTPQGCGASLGASF